MVVNRRVDKLAQSTENKTNKPVGDMVRSLGAEKVLIFVQKGT